jgi:hypothetical protein
MFTASSSTALNMTYKLLADVSKDVSARPAWFILPSGLDLSAWQVVEYLENDLTENSIRLPDGYLVFKPLPRPMSVFTPKTELAARLWEIRKRIAASEPLLDWDGIEKEVSERRAERG